MRLFIGVVVCLFAATVALSATDLAVPGEKLDQASIRAELNKYLELVAPKMKIQKIAAEVGEPIILRGDQIEFLRNKDNTPQKLIWNYETEKPLSAQQEDKVQGELAELMNNFLGQFLSVNPAPFREVFKAVRNPVRKAPTPGAGPTTPSTAKPAASATPVGGQYYVVYGWQYNCCMNCWSVVPAWVAFPMVQQAPVDKAENDGHLAQESPKVIAKKPVAEEFRDDYPKTAEECYRLGCAAYRTRYYSLARAYFNEAVRLNEQDARFWFFKAFTEQAMLSDKLALASARRAQQLQARGLPAREQIDLALQRLPASAKEFLDSLPAIEASVPAAVAAKR